jgi:hypothetical protein
LLAAQAIPAIATAPTVGDRRAASTDEMATGPDDARSCRRIERIGKVTIRRCQ